MDTNVMEKDTYMQHLLPEERIPSYMKAQEVGTQFEQVDEYKTGSLTVKTLKCTDPNLDDWRISQISKNGEVKSIHSTVNGARGSYFGPSTMIFDDKNEGIRMEFHYKGQKITEAQQQAAQDVLGFAQDRELARQKNGETSDVEATNVKSLYQNMGPDLIRLGVIEDNSRKSTMSPKDWNSYNKFMRNREDEFSHFYNENEDKKESFSTFVERKREEDNSASLSDAQMAQLRSEEEFRRMQNQYSSAIAARQEWAFYTNRDLSKPFREVGGSAKSPVIRDVKEVTPDQMSWLEMKLNNFAVIFANALLDQVWNPDNRIRGTIYRRPTELTDEQQKELDAAKDKYLKEQQQKNSNEADSNAANTAGTVSNHVKDGTSNTTPTAASSNSAAALLSVSDDRDLKNAITAIADGVDISEGLTKKKITASDQEVLRGMSPDVAKTLTEQIKDGVKPTEALANIVSQQNTLHPDNEMKRKPEEEALEKTVQNEMKPK